MLNIMKKLGKKDDIRKAILEAEDIETREVEVPEWGMTVIVKGMTGAQRDRFESSIVEQRGKNVKVKLEDARARLVAMTVIDEDGRQVFGMRDVEALSQKSARALNRIYDVAKELSGIGEEEIEELAKNFENGQPEDSLSG